MHDPYSSTALSVRNVELFLHVLVVCENKILEPPDGGWGWVVVFSSCFLNFLVLGISQTFSLYIEDYTIAFKSGVAPVVFANSLLVGILQIIGKFLTIIFLDTLP